MVSDCSVSIIKVFGIDMNATTGDVIVKIFIILYDLILVAGTAYLVTFHDWSLWTFLITICFFITTKRSDDSEKKE